MPTSTDPQTLHCALRGARYPALPRDLAGVAEHNRASRSVLQLIRALPVRPYEGPNQVCMAVHGRFGECARGL
ncbi:DUF2795 domain-containing protein [Streptomyces sp. SID3343]|uniref:DUF2795 domain-containing protein n=1 Tax=Streptomyces sp. SID3343 TaxID=2690260 RepID=UPI00136BA9CE|nr:DUF2795 domain-containing protein [Streptomyces sp. SID3343]MYV99297.1 DUF2795 domain-containing protein [Streptomyces sp. SID3343]